MKPTIGRIVHYKLGENDLSSIKDKGGNAHCYKAGEAVAAIVTCVWSETCVNLRLVLDGPTDAWLTSRSLKPENTEGQVCGFWEWPERVA